MEIPHFQIPTPISSLLFCTVREQLGYTQLKMAAKLGCTRSLLVMIELEQRTASVALLKKLVRISESDSLEQLIYKAILFKSF